MNMIQTDNINDMNMDDDDQASPDTNEVTYEIDTPREFKYLEELIAFRLGNWGNPSFPDFNQWSLPLKNFILDSHMEDQEGSNHPFTDRTGTSCRPGAVRQGYSGET
jgi:hypothetical protein